MVRSALLATLIILIIHAPSPCCGQVQLQTNYLGAAREVVDSDGLDVTLLVDGKPTETLRTDYEIRAHDRFGDGYVEIKNPQPDFHPTAPPPTKKNKDRAAMRFRYTADLVADRELNACYGLLTFVTEGSIGSRLVKIGRLDPGKPTAITLELDVPVGKVGSLHVFSHALEIKTNQHPGPYDMQAYYASLTAGVKGVPAAALVELKSMLPHVLSPDGRLLATVRQRKGTTFLIVYDLESMKLVCEAKPDDLPGPVSDLTWVSDHEIAYVVGWSLRLLDTQTAKARKLLEKETVTEIIPMEGSRDTLLLHVGLWFGDYTAKFNVRTGKLFDRVDPDEGGYFMFDRKGVARVRVQQDVDETFYSYRPSPTADWKFLDHGTKQKGLKFNLRSWETLDRVVELDSVGPDGDILYLSTRVNSDKFELAAFSMSKGVILQTIAAHPKYDLTTSEGSVARLLFAKESPRLLGMIYEAQKPHVIWLDQRFEAAQKNIDHSIPDHVNLPLDWTDDGRSFIYLSFSDRDPGTYYAFRPYEGKLIPLLELASQLDGKALGTTTAFEFTARDGQKIPAYVTCPPGAEHTRTPLIVSIHGGPMARDSWGFDPDNQFFASRGYRVLQVNYRGSSGYGAAFQSAGLRARLDTVVIDDIADGVRYLIGQGEVDPERIAVTGASFGGWATYLSLIRYPELYRCGIATAAVSNWRADMKQYRQHHVGGYEFWKTLLNRRDFKAEEKFIEPTLRAEELKQPIMIMQGRKDTIVSPKQAEAMYDALKKTNAHVEIRWFDFSGHGDWPVSDHVALLNDSAAFLEQWLAPARVSSAASPVTTTAGDR